MPTAVLIVVLLSALAVDSALSLVTQRELVVAAEAAANDVAGASLDPDAYYSRGELRIDPRRAERVVAASLTARGIEASVVSVEVVPGPPDRVVVRLEATVEHIFSRALPGRAASSTVRATASAHLSTG